MNIVDDYPLAQGKTLDCVEGGNLVFVKAGGSMRFSSLVTRFRFVEPHFVRV